MNLSPELIGIIGIAALIVLILTKMWIGVALGVVGFVGIIAMRGLEQAFMVVGSSPFQNINNYTITVIPMFTLMGMVISESDIGQDLFKTANSWLGHKRGGLASASVVASGMLGAITGSHMVSTVIMSKIAYPEMKRYNYHERLATGSIAAGAPLAIIIPPSMPMIMYGIITEQPIGKMFMSGLIPGVLMVLIFVLIISLVCRRNPAMGPRAEKLPLKERIRSLKGVLPMIILFVLVLGGIYAGIFTTTESGAVGAIGAIIISLCTGQLSWKKFVVIMKETVLTTCMVLFLLVGTYIFIYFISLSKLPFLVTNLVIGLNASRWIMIVALAVMYIVLGMVLPEIPMIVLTIPILYPAVTAIGIDPIWFGLFVVLMMALGPISPPIGMTVFMLSGLTKQPVTKIYRGVLPFILGDILVIILVVFFPILATWIPSMMP